MISLSKGRGRSLLFPEDNSAKEAAFLRAVLKRGFENRDVRCQVEVVISTLLYGADI